MLKKSQVWVETAIYTLIGLTIISIILSTALPQIEKIRDRETIKQTITALNKLNLKISEARESIGSIRTADLKLSKGRLEINPENDTLVYILENTKLELSEPGIKIKEGDVIVQTEKYGSRFNIFLSLNHSGSINMTYLGGNGKKTLQPGSVPYNIKIENMGVGPDTRYVLDFSLT